MTRIHKPKDKNRTHFEHPLGLIVTPLLLVSFGIPAVALANPISTAQSIYYYEPYASSACDGLATFETAAINNWRSAMSSNGATLGVNDGTVFWTELADVAAGGTDSTNANLDTADAVILGTHGVGVRTPTSCYTTASSSCSYTDWRAQLSTEQAGSCLIAATDDMLMGNYQAEYFDLFSCESMEPKGGISYTLDATYRLHQWHGFAGIMATGTGTTTDIDDYVDDAFDGSAAWAWLENMVSWNHWGSSSDVCPFPLVFGATGTDATSRRDNEQYGVGFYSDPTADGWSHVYYTACDPPSPIPGSMGGWGI